MASRDRAEQTFRWDLVRGTSQGVLEMCFQNFALLTAIRVFGASETIKPLIPASFAAGLLLSPLSYYAISRLNLRAGAAAGILFLMCAAALALSVVSPIFGVFLGGIILAQFSIAQTPPLGTHIYNENYGSRERGRRVSTALLLTALVGAAGAYAGGALLDIDLSLFRLLFGLACVAAITAAVAMWRMPSSPIDRAHSGNPLSNLKLIKEDKVFGVFLGGWMLMGLGNLMSMPIRIEYIANARYGVGASNAEVALIITTIPLVVRLISTKLWGAFFDAFNVITMRITLNLLFFTSIVLFFATKNIWVMGVASVCFGLAAGGAGIIWTLWVTKIAPPGKASTYMSVHTSMTGVRGVMAPFIGYFIVTTLSPSMVGWIGGGLVMLSTILFVFLRFRLRL